MLRPKNDDEHQSTSSAGHFDSHGGVPMQYQLYLLMQHAQGYTDSHWTPPSGGYLLCIAPAAARIPSKTTTIKKINLLCLPFQWSWHRIGSILRALTDGGNSGLY
jgi:hypothetical protein